jgi:hypothetical protein
MYLDTNLNLTIGIGTLMEGDGKTPPTELLELPWKTAAGMAAPAAQIAAEWHYVQTRTDLATRGGGVYADVTHLRISAEVIDALLWKRTRPFWERLKFWIPSLENWPADAQLAILDMGYNHGPNFLNLASWADLRAPVAEADFTTIAALLRSRSTHRRFQSRAKLFDNAAIVKARGLDPDVLWGEERTPVSVAPPKGNHMQSPKYRKGRGRMRWGRVVFLVTHTAEGGSSAVALGNYFRDTDRNVSSHCGIGVDGEYVTYVSYNDTAWTAAPINDDGDQCELMGYARWSRSDWLKQTKMLGTFARWLAWRSEVRNIPLRVLTAAQAKQGTPGILMHRTVTAAWPDVSSHTDPGPNFPWDVVLKRANEIKNPPVDTRDEFERAAAEDIWKVPIP